MEKHLCLTTTHYDRTFQLNQEDPILHDTEFYRKIVGWLLYLIMTRPDNAFFVHTLHQQVHALQKSHLEAVMRVVRCVKKSPGQGLFFSAANKLDSMSIYCDSDWGACVVSFKSITRYCIKLGCSMVS